MTQSHSRSVTPGLAWALALLAVLVAAPLHAQPSFELNDQGEFEPVAEPDPATPAGQLQLIRRQLVEGRAARAEDAATGWLEENPYDPQVVEAYLIRGDAKFAQGDYYRSLMDYELILGLYPGTEQYVTALEREYDIATLYIGGVYRKTRWLGLRLFPADDVGVELLIRIQERLPGSNLGERASIAIGDYYFDKGEMDLAAEAYDLFMLNYPQSRRREWAMLRQIQASLARYKGPQFDPSGLTDAAQRLREYMHDYPSAAEKIGANALLVRINESLADKKLVTAQWYEKRGMDRGAATLYRRVINDFPRSNAAQSALARLDELGQPLVDPRDPLYRANNAGQPSGDDDRGTPPIQPGGQDGQ